MNAYKEQLVEIIVNQLYRSANFQAAREYDGHTPNGNRFNGRWVLRSLPDGNYIDFDQYRSDLVERHNLELTY